MDTNKIFELLEKEKLTLEEKKELNRIISENPEAGKIVNLFTNVKQITETGSHPDTETLAEYTMYLNNLPDAKDFPVKLIPKIENHLKQCAVCRNNFETMQAEFEATDKFVSEYLTDEIEKKNTGQETFSLRQRLIQNDILKTAVYSIAAIFLIYISVFAFVNLTTPVYKKELVVFNGNQKFIARGRVSSEFQKGIAELDKRNFEKAIENLQADIKDHPNDKTIFYTYFILGKTYLESAKNNILGIYNDYDEGKIKNAISSFRKAIEKNTSPEFQHINLDSYYYIARGLLLLDEKEEAKKYLKTVIDKKGSFKKEAEKILKSLES